MMIKIVMKITKETREEEDEEKEEEINITEIEKKEQTPTRSLSMCRRIDT